MSCSFACIESRASQRWHSCYHNWHHVIVVEAKASCPWALQVPARLQECNQGHPLSLFLHWQGTGDWLWHMQHSVCTSRQQGHHCSSSGLLIYVAVVAVAYPQTVLALGWDPRIQLFFHILWLWEDCWCIRFWAYETAVIWLWGSVPAVPLTQEPGVYAFLYKPPRVLRIHQPSVNFEQFTGAWCIR